MLTNETNKTIFSISSNKKKPKKLHDIFNYVYIVSCVFGRIFFIDYLEYIFNDILLFI